MVLAFLLTMLAGSDPDKFELKISFKQDLYPALIHYLSRDSVYT